MSARLVMKLRVDEASAVLIALGLFIRLRLAETPVNRAGSGPSSWRPRREARP